MKKQKTIWSEKLISIRETKQWTQQELADQIGASRCSIIYWENGYFTPNIHIQQKIDDLYFNTKNQQLTI